MNDNAGGNSPTIVEQNYADQTNQFIIIEGCKNPNKRAQKIILTLNNIINPYMVRTTSPFKIQIYKAWDSATKTLSQELMALTDFSLDASLFQTNALTFNSITNTNYIVQENGELTLVFKTATDMPSLAVTAGMLDGIHIRFPAGFTMPSQASEPTLQADGTDVTLTSFEKDTASTYDSNCILQVCFLLQFESTNNVPAGTTFTLKTTLLNNPVSIYPVDDIKIKTQAKYDGDVQFYNTDVIQTVPTYPTKAGEITYDSTNPLALVPGQATQETYAPGNVLTYTFTTNHATPQNGRIRFKLGKDFTINSESSAISRFTVVSSDGSVNYVTADAVSSEPGNSYVQGIVTTPIPENTVVKATLAGIRNPRYLISDSDFPTDSGSMFSVFTYDSRGSNDAENLIDSGFKGYLAINVLQQFTTFNIEPQEVVNGAVGSIMVTWYSRVETLNDDFVMIDFPEGEVSLEKPSGRNTLLCEPKTDAVSVVICEFDLNSMQLKIKLVQVNRPTGLFKVNVHNLRNPPSLRGSSDMTSIKQMTGVNQQIAEYTGSIRIVTETASELLGLTPANIQQTNTNYETPADYTITFKPNSIVRTYPLSIVLQYPSTITPDFTSGTPSEDDVICEVLTSGQKPNVRADQSWCRYVLNSRTFNMTNVVRPGYDLDIILKLRFINPIDNWGNVGFKIRTYETVPNTDGTFSYYLVDKHEDNILIPELDCKKPCKTCYQTPGTTVVPETPGADSYCETCWFKFPQKYLMKLGPYLDDGSGAGSTCKSECDDGWTSNGKDNLVCEKCNPSCATCEDSGQDGDKDRCLTCAPTHPFIYTRGLQCFEKCGLGFYTVPGTTEKACDTCSQPCHDCDGSSVNCIKCDPTSTTPGLFILEVELAGGVKQERGTCYNVCPLGYFMDKSDPESLKCTKCTSPCASCVERGDKCLTCDGTGNRYFVDINQNTCHAECPSGTTPDMATQKCFRCQANCARCTSPEGNSCLECDRPFLLEDGECKTQCENEGYFPNNDKTICINQIEFPTIGPIFTICVLIVSILIAMVKCYSKETELLPTFIAFVSVIEVFAILFCIAMTQIFEQERIFYFCTVTYVALVILNIVNHHYVVTTVEPPEATIKKKISNKKMRQLEKEFIKWDKRMKKYEKTRQSRSTAKTGWKSALTKLGTKLNNNSQDDANEPLINGNEGGEIEMAVIRKRELMIDLDNLSDPGDSISMREGGSSSSDSENIPARDSSDSNESDEQSENSSDTRYEGGSKAKGGKKQVEITQAFFKAKGYHGVEKNPSDGKFYEIKVIGDKGFKRWADAYPQVYSVIKWVGLILTFKFYRMTYSYFLRKKQFLVLYQKKKFKKMTIVLTLLSQFLVELPNIIAAILGFSQLQFNQQVTWSVLDCFFISVVLILIEFCEIAKLDKIMKTANTKGHQLKKSAAACESSEETDFSDDDDEDEYDDYPDWRVTIQDVVGNPKLFAQDSSQMKINKWEKRYDPRIADSAREFFDFQPDDDDWDVTDERKVRSYPTSPRIMKEFAGINPGNWGPAFDNVYAESKAPLDTKGRDFSEAGTQAALNDITTALARKAAGGELLTPGLDKDDYSRRRNQKKKRGRKNKYYRQIDAEDDQEADQMSDGSDEDDALDGIKEADDEDDEDEKIRQLKEKAERDAKEARDRAAQEAAQRQQEQQEAQRAEEAKQAEIDALKQQQEQEDLKRKEEQEKARAAKLEKDQRSDAQSELSLMMAQSNQMNKFGAQGVEAPPNAESRKFNECDIIGNLQRDEKGNVIMPDQDPKSGKYLDKDGKMTNERGYLIDGKSGDVVNNMNGERMFAKQELDEKGEVPAPFSIEKHNFNPHGIRGDFDFDRNGKSIVPQDPKTPNHFVDRQGSRVSSRGYRIDSKGHIVDNYGRKKVDRSHATEDGDLPRMFNYNGRRFDITDTLGQLDKDANGNIMPQTNQNGQLVDNLNRPVNSKGYLIDEQGNVIDRDGKVLFLKSHLKDDEIPKIFPFTKFNIKNVLGDFEMDPLGQPILDRDNKGNLIDRQGRKVNSKGYLVDKDGNVINKHGKKVFEKHLLDSEEDIPKVFRTGLLKTDSASSLSRLMSEIGREPPSGDEGQVIDGRGMERMSAGTSEGDEMGITPADYNTQNMMHGAREMDDEIEEGDQEYDDEDDMDSEIGRMVAPDGYGAAGVEMALKKRRKKKKKKRRKRVEMEDPSLREHLLAGAYGGVAKPKPKRVGVKYTTDLTSGLRDIATPGNAFIRDQSMKKMMTSFSGNMGMAAPESSRGRRQYRDGQRIRSSAGRSDAGSAIGSKLGSKLSRVRPGESTSKLLNPQQREDQLKRETMEAIARKKAAKKAKKAGKISKDADFEKMFGKDIDEFLEDSEFDIESMDKMSQFSKGSKQTIRSASNANRLRGLEKVYLQRMEANQAKETLGARPKGKGGKFRDPSGEHQK